MASVGEESLDSWFCYWYQR